MQDFLAGVDLLAAWVQSNGWVVAGLGYLYCNFTQALPAPTTRDSRFYLFLYRFLHIVAGNTGLVRKPPKGTL